MILERLGRAYLPANPELWSNPEIVIDKEKCTGCGNCAAICPMVYLEVLNKTAQPIEGALCFGCSNCVRVCKEDAISMDGFYNVHQGFFKTLLFSPQDGYPNPPAVDGVKGMTAVEEVIYRRRSNRFFKKDPVPDELLRRVIEAGRFAPSAGNGQPWSFIVINDRKELDELIPYVELLFKLLVYFYGLGKKNVLFRDFWSIASTILPKLLDQRSAAGALRHIRPNDTFWDASSLIIILGDKRGLSDLSLDIGICSQNMTLTAHSLGLGTCYNSFFINAIKFIPPLKWKLGIKSPYKAVSAMTLGFPRVETDGLVERQMPRITWHKGGKVWEEMPQ